MPTHTLQPVRIPSIRPVVFGEICSDETMIVRADQQQFEKYYGVGLNGLMTVAAIVQTYGIQPKRILDLPSGYGRVLRFLRAAYPAAEIYAGEISAEAVQFCAKNFNAIPALSNSDFELDIPDNFDVIWVGSLLTHLPEHRATRFLTRMSQYLAQDGVLIVTTHGNAIRDRIRKGERFGVDHDTLLAGHRDGGYGFSVYPNMSDYGVSLVAQDWYAQQAPGGLVLASYIEQGWAGHDVAVYRRESRQG